LNNGALRFENVSFSYPTRPDVPVLKCLTIEVPQGMTTAIVGASGSGKSTMLELVARFYEVTGVRTKPGESNDRDIESESESECGSGGGCGRVLFDGHDVLDLDPTWLRRHVAMVRQEPVMFGMTIRENIAYACAAAGRDVSNAEVIAAAKRAHAHEFISQFPEGYETLVGERGIRLSGGQKQRLAIARAILVDPKVLLLDEATSALDATSEVLVQEALSHFMQGRTVMMVAHRLSTVRDADQIVMLEAGTVVDVGTHDVLLARCEPYRTLVKKQLEPAPAANAPPGS